MFVISYEGGIPTNHGQVSYSGCTLEGTPYPGYTSDYWSHRYSLSSRLDATKEQSWSIWVTRTVNLAIDREACPKRRTSSVSLLLTLWIYGYPLSLYCLVTAGQNIHLRFRNTPISVFQGPWASICSWPQTGRQEVSQRQNPRLKIEKIRGRYHSIRWPSPNTGASANSRMFWRGF